MMSTTNASGFVLMNMMNTDVENVSPNSIERKHSYNQLNKVYLNVLIF